MRYLIACVCVPSGCLCDQRPVSCALSDILCYRLLRQRATMALHRPGPKARLWQIPRRRLANTRLWSSRVMRSSNLSLWYRLTCPVLWTTILSSCLRCCHLYYIPYYSSSTFVQHHGNSTVFIHHGRRGHSVRGAF